MTRFLRFTLRTFTFMVLLLVLGLGVIGWLGSEHLVTPKIRELQSYHHEILEAPDEYGLRITRHQASSGIPYLMAVPSPRPGTATKSRELRASLSKSDTPPESWGRIHGTVVLLHGHGGRKEDHLPISERFCAAGFRCIMPDLPGHGDSPLQRATFGKQEAALIEALLAEAEEAGGFDSQPAFLFGISQGGAISLLTAARHPDRWAGVVSVATFTSLDEVIDSSARNFHPALRPLAPLVTFAVDCGTRLRAGFSPAEVRPIDVAGQLDLPVMIAHGNRDHYIPIGHGQRLFEALPSPTKAFYEVEGAGHGWVMGKDARRLYPAICSFMLSSLDH